MAPHSLPVLLLRVGRLLGRHCGTMLPAAVDTSDSFAYVRFVSDPSGNAPGFSLSFEASVEGMFISRLMTERFNIQCLDILLPDCRKAPLFILSTLSVSLSLFSFSFHISVPFVEIN